MRKLNKSEIPKYSPVRLSWKWVVRKLEKTKENAGAGYEASACFMARDVSENYQSQIYRPLEH